MAKRKRTFSLDSLVAELSDLDARRKTVVNQLNAAIRSLAGGGAALVASFSPVVRRGRPARAKTVKRKTGRRRTMSAAARKKISQAQKKRWAQQKSGTK